MKGVDGAVRIRTDEQSWLATDVDPEDARSNAGFVSLLRRRREVAGLSYRELARRARQLGESLPPSTVATMLGRSTMPGPDLVATYVRACGGGETEVGVWLAARARIASSAVAPSAATVTPTAPGAPVSPRQLPADVIDVVGRERELALLDAAASRPGSVLIVVTGPPAVGKSALAIHWAHRVSGRYPDGQLYVDLHGHGLRAPLPVATALSHLLVGLGVPADAVPAAEQEAAALFRSVTTDRRILVVLDAAASTDQVRLLRPGGPGSCTIVTSRDRLVGLTVRDGGREVAVPALDRRPAVRVLAQAAGEEVVAAELTAAGTLVELCDGLPLALRIAAAALDRRTPAPIAQLVAGMHNGGRLAALDVLGAPEVRLETVFGCSYRELDAPNQRLLRLLGTLPEGPFTGVDVAMATETPIGRTRTGLARLAEANLLVRLGGDRYTMSNLLREYARGLSPDAEQVGGSAAA